MRARWRLTGLVALFLLILLASYVPDSSQAAPTALPPKVCMPPIQPVTLVNPTVITGCTEANLRTALAAGGHITFDCGPNPVTILITSPLVTSATVDIVLDGQGLVTLDGGNSTRILQKPFTPGSDSNKSLGNDLTLQNITLVNGRAPAATHSQDANARGGAVWATSPGTKLHIINSTFENNATTSITDEDNQGGAVFVANIYETIIVGSVFENNVAGNGGGFGAIASGLIVYNSRFTNNQAADMTPGGIVRGHGGAIHLDGVTNSFNPDSRKIVAVCGSEFTGNTAVRGGGALKVTISDGKGTKATYERSTFNYNWLVGTPDVEGHGGAIYHIEDDYVGATAEDNIEIRDSLFVNNYAQRQGGGVWLLVNGNGRIINTTFSQNAAATAGTNIIGQGGALVISRGVIDIVNSTFAQNFATFQGGAIHAGGSGDPLRVVTLANSLFYDNRLDPMHTDPVTTEWQGYHTNRPLQNGGNNLQYPRTKAPDFDNTVNNFITSPESAILFADPLLGVLADNGGPTETRALSSGSPAIDAGNNLACPATDQRGITRPQGGGCDIGAYELLVVLTVSPAMIDASSPVALTIKGYGFTAASHVLWDGTAVPTTYIDPLTLQADLETAVIGTPRLVPVRVDNNSLPAATVWVVENLQQVYLPLVTK
ncbi:MAG: hypothetical protein H6667_12585 [Ardenticatenaceae bacterium]|nr:hypothetical protein [Ardenticatenaceae bacterium]MCB9443535.1 hypothetical protein [Ardenticatenaceae bacterium]